MCLHEQRDRPPPPGGEFKGGIKVKSICCMDNGKTDSGRASQQHVNMVDTKQQQSTAFTSIL
jgi:hypothetical protein